MQEHPWLDRLYVKLALQVKKKKEQKQQQKNKNKNKKLAITEPKMKNQNQNHQNQEKLGELTLRTPATHCGGWACRWIMELKRH